MSDFSSVVKNKFLSALNEYSMLKGCNEIVVGFSGGADSVCLLHLLNEYSQKFSYKLIAAHLNHGIRGDEALRDAEFCESFCNMNNIPLRIKSVDCVSIAKNSDESVEECGRRLRYEFFDSLCKDGTKIATAHNLNDNVETVVFNIVRGSGLKGAGGISAVRGDIIRPIINCTRTEIEGYCKENNLSFVTDSTNLCNDYTRNKIRNSVLPLLSEINNGAVKNINSFSNNSKEVYSFVNEFSQKILDKATFSDGFYNAELISNQHIAVAKECIVIAFSRFCNISLPSIKINDVYNLLFNKGRLQLFGNIYAEVIKNRFRFFINESAKENETVCLDLNADEMSFDYNGYEISLIKKNNSKIVNKNLLDNSIDCDKIVGNLFLRSRNSGDSFTFYKRKVTKTLKKIFNEMEIPVEKRNSIPVLCDDAGVVWVYLLGVNERCRADDNTDNIIYVGGKTNGK